MLLYIIEHSSTVEDHVSAHSLDAIAEYPAPAIALDYSIEQLNASKRLVRLLADLQRGELMAFQS